jgi:predicted SAM-dependent methyltransferase
MISLDLGCGVRKKDGHIGFDIAAVDGVDVVCDINSGICIKDNRVDRIYSSFFFEHARDIFFLMQEISRSCRNGARVELWVPYYTSINAFQDPTHHTFFCEETFDYFSDFRLKSIEYDYAHIIRDWYPQRLKRFLRLHLMNAVGNMRVVLEVNKGGQQ